MISPAKQTANQANAQHSTASARKRGPKTPEGSEIRRELAHLTASAPKKPRRQQDSSAACIASKPKPAPATTPTPRSSTRNVRKRNDVVQKKFDRLIVQNEHFEQDKTFHSMQSLIDARVAQQNSERTQPPPEPPAAELMFRDLAGIGRSMPLPSRCEGLPIADIES